MIIEERLARLKGFCDSFNVSQGFIYAEARFPQNWKICPNTEELYKVRCTLNESKTGYYFFAPLSEGFDKVFDAIEYNVNSNKEAQEKVSLFREKMKELEAFFGERNIEDLRRMEFIIPPLKKEEEEKEQTKPKKEKKQGKRGGKTKGKEILLEKKMGKEEESLSEEAVEDFDL